MMVLYRRNDYFIRLLACRSIVATQSSRIAISASGDVVAVASAGRALK